MDIRETSINIFKFLNDTFQFNKEGKLEVIDPKYKNTELSFNGLLGAVIVKFPEVKTNVLIPTKHLIRTWLNEQARKVK